MEIKFHGHACFSIKEQKTVLVADPYENSTGLKLPSLSADIVTVSFEDSAHSNVKAIEGSPKILDWPGEYEIMGISIKGIHSFHNPKEDKEQKENVIFHITWNGIRLCHLGSQGTKPTPEQLEKIGDVDVLFVPVGRKDSMNAKKAKEVVEQIEPRILIPMLYDTEGSKLELDAVEPFLSAMGAKNAERLDVLTFKKSELPVDTSKLIVLNVVD